MDQALERKTSAISEQKPGASATDGITVLMAGTNISTSSTDSLDSSDSSIADDNGSKPQSTSKNGPNRGSDEDSSKRKVAPLKPDDPNGENGSWLMNRIFGAHTCASRNADVLSRDFQSIAITSVGRRTMSVSRYQVKYQIAIFIVHCVDFNP
jgi:hypothetical protein